MKQNTDITIYCKDNISLELCQNQLRDLKLYLLLRNQLYTCSSQFPKPNMIYNSRK